MIFFSLDLNTWKITKCLMYDEVKNHEFFQIFQPRHFFFAYDFPNEIILNNRTLLEPNNVMAISTSETIGWGNRTTARNVYEFSSIECE